MPDIAFSLLDIGKHYDGKPIIENISLSFFHGAKIGIVGENGSGKTTLLRIMSGEDAEFHGERTVAKNLSILHVPQEPRLTDGTTVRQNLEEAVRPILAMIERYEEIGERLAEDIEPDEMDALLAEMDHLQQHLDATDGWDIDRHLAMAADALVLPPDESLVDTLSGGERRRLALCKALLEKPDVLLLDEPTNHLDAETIAWLEQALRDYSGTVIIVTHDRYFLDNVTKWILELDRGRGIPFEGNYSSWLAQKAERLRLQEKRESERQRSLKRELDWLTKGRRHRQKNLARVKRYDEMSEKSFELASSEAVIQIPPGPPLGERVLHFDGVTKGFGDVTLVDNLSFDLPRGAMVGVIGPNGAGKTTLFRMIMGLDSPDGGTLQPGPSVALSYVDQERDALVDDNTIFEEITGGSDEVNLGGRKLNSRAYVARFNFRGSQQQKKVGKLSGGERNRVHLAKLLKTGGNVLLLDEPTNDLDVATMRVLEDALDQFPACALIISHDRYFLDRICSHLLVFEGDGKVRWFEGNFHDYEDMVLAKRERGNRRSRYRRLPVVR